MRISARHEGLDVMMDGRFRVGIISCGKAYDLRESGSRKEFVKRLAFVANELCGPVYLREKHEAIEDACSIARDVADSLKGGSRLYINHPEMIMGSEIEDIIEYGEKRGVLVGVHLDFSVTESRDRAVHRLSRLLGRFRRLSISFPVHDICELRRAMSIYDQAKRSILKAYAAKSAKSVIISPIFHTDCKRGITPLMSDEEELKYMIEVAKDKGFETWLLGGINEDNAAMVSRLNIDGVLTMSGGMDLVRGEATLLKMAQIGMNNRKKTV